MKRSAEDEAQTGGMDNTWWLESSREASGRSATRESRDPSSGSGKGSRSSCVGIGGGGGFGALELDSMRLLADLVASSATPSEGGKSTTADKGIYSLHRDMHRRSADHRPQHFHPAAAKADNFFLPDSPRRQGAPGGGGSSGGGSSCSDCSGSRGSGSGSRGSSGGVSLSAMSPPHRAAHVHREWRGILGGNSNGGGSGGGGGGGDGRGRARSPSNEESGPTDGSSTHGNGTSLGGSGADSGSSSHRSSARGADCHLSGIPPNPPPFPFPGRTDSPPDGFAAPCCIRPTRSPRSGGLALPCRMRR